MPKLSEATEFEDDVLPTGSFIAVAIPSGTKFVIRKVSPDIVGALGPAGDAGPRGAQINSGVGAPDDASGLEGDYWLDTATGQLYLKSSGAYSLIVDLTGPTGADGAQGPPGPAATPGGATTQVQYNDGGAFNGDANLTFDNVTGETVGKNFRITPLALAYAASVDLDFASNGFQTVSLTGNIAFTTSNRASGRMMAVKIESDASIRTLTFPAGWTFVGMAAPASIAASKKAVLSITCFGANDSDVIAAYAEEP